MPERSDTLLEWIAEWKAAKTPKEQAQLLWDTFSLDGHTHTASQVYTDDSETETLEEVLEEDSSENDTE